MRRISYSDHAIKRMKQRGLTPMEITSIIEYPKIQRRQREGTLMAIGVCKNRKIKVIYKQKETIIRIITIR